jgi:hypothetical protein
VSRGLALESRGKRRDRKNEAGRRRDRKNEAGRRRDRKNEATQTYRVLGIHI